ncbi:MAG: LacI family DNA-binding transcriptional regulator [Pseudomonadales bacterium]
MPTPKVTIDDVARAAGVSIKTVSRVTNREPNVREATRQKVERAIAELSYRPNQSARNLASHRSRLIALVYDDPSVYDIPSSGYIIKMQQGALRACQRDHYDLLIHPCNYRSRGVGAELQALIEHARADGIVLAAPLSNMPKIVRAIEATGTRFVRLSPGVEKGGQLSVSTNDREISAEMTRYLASLGHKRIAFIKGDPTHKAVANRFLGYRDGLQQSGVDFSDELVAAGDNSFGSGERCAAELLQRDNPPTAVFAANDDMAAGVIRVADRLGIGIPARLSVAGFDDIALARLVYPALTTIRQPLAVMADRAVAAIIAAASAGAQQHGTIVIPAELQIRESTGPAPAD